MPRGGGVKQGDEGETGRKKTTSNNNKWCDQMYNFNNKQYFVYVLVGWSQNVEQDWGTTPPHQQGSAAGM